MDDEQDTPEANKTEFDQQVAARQEDPLTDLPVESSMASLEPQKRSKKPLLVTLFMALLLAGAGAAWWFAPRDSNEPIDTKTTQSTTTKPLATKPANTDVQALLEGARDKIGSGTIGAEYAAPDYMFAGTDFYSVGRKSSSKSLVAQLPKNELKTAAGTLESYLFAQGFKKSPQQVVDSYYPLVKYQNSDTFCGVNYFDDGAAASLPLYLACAPLASYNETAKIQKAFYDAYRSANSDAKFTPDSRLGYPVIKDSKTTGYATAQASIYGEATPTGAMGLFYMTPSEGWKYFKGTQQAIPCTDYNTSDLKKAYLGEACYDLATDKESTVTL